MLAALTLARGQSGRTGTNPAVGCVIVADGTVVGCAATADGGRPHAEDRALADAGPLARGATVYVTLEPCNARSGGGVSCTDLLIQAGVARVVYACADPHPLAAGKGADRLRASGIAVEVGLKGQAAMAVNHNFFQRIAQAAEPKASTKASEKASGTRPPDGSSLHD